MTDLVPTLIAAGVHPLLAVLAAGLLLVLSVAAKRAADWLRLDADAKVRAALLPVLDLVVEAAEERLSARMVDLPDGDADNRFSVMQGEEVYRAAHYVARRMPGALARLGVDEVGLCDMIRTRLAANGAAHG